MREDEDRKYCELILEINKLQVRQAQFELEIIREKNEANASSQREITSLQQQLGVMQIGFEITRAIDAQNARDQREKLQFESALSGVVGTALVGAGIVGLVCPPVGLACAALAGGGGLIAYAVDGKARIREATQGVPTRQPVGLANTGERRPSADSGSTRFRRNTGTTRMRVPSNS